MPVPECRETITNRGLTVPEHQRASFFPGHSSNAYRANELIQGGIDDGAELRALDELIQGGIDDGAELRALAPGL